MFERPLPEDLERHLLTSEDCLQKGDLPGALAASTRSLLINSSDFRALALSGLALAQMGELEKGVSHLKAALKGAGENPDMLFNLGLALKELGNADESVEVYHRALKAAPDMAPAAFNLGNILHEKGAFKEAEEAYCQALKAEPEMVGAKHNLAQTLQKAGRRAEAILLYLAYIVNNPNDADAHYNLAVSLHQEGRYEEASRAYRSALAIDPSNEAARHLCIALAGENSDSPPDSYVLGLFDAYAEQYEKHLIENLGYCVPEAIQALVAEASDNRRFSRGLDLGCGTGLIGDAFGDRVDRLVGVDLSNNMLEAARQKSIYHALHHGNLVDFLEGVQAYDLVLAADAFNYVGALNEVFHRTARCLEPSGYFAFSVENVAGDGFKLLPSGRYGHSQFYIENLASENGLNVVAGKLVSIRKERGKAIAGTLFVLRKPNK